ncbi:hypothetical protein [Oceanobacter mangrovi]|uniref:hypothetical protein n=1 Tax=Oceanobacter mangrovi TaxID=2862510 RepID=UPI001C8D4169|nr:hypothetical protein [Oceanobacter mangrovi]
MMMLTSISSALTAGLILPASAAEPASADNRKTEAAVDPQLLLFLAQQVREGDDWIDLVDLVDQPVLTEPADNAQLASQTSSGQTSKTQAERPEQEAANEHD